MGTLVGPIRIEHHELQQNCLQDPSHDTNSRAPHEFESQSQSQNAQVFSETEGRPIVDRVIYFGLMSFISPLVNLVLYWDNAKSMGITFGLNQWLLFGVFWCAAFSPLLGALFTSIANAFRILDVIPALGSSIWVCSNTFLMVAVLKGIFGISVPFLHNLPLFSLIIANSFLVAAEFRRENPRYKIFFQIAEFLSGGRDLSTSKSRSYKFVDGTLKCDSSPNATNQPSANIVHPLSVPEDATRAFVSIAENGIQYLNGESSMEFQEKFTVWKLQAQSLNLVFVRRRLFCLIGILFEAVTVVFVISILGNVSTPSSSQSGIPVFITHPHPYFTSPLEFSLLQIVVCVFLLCFSDYLRILVNIRSSFTSDTEVRAFMWQCISSRWLNWSGSRKSYLDNGRWLHGPKMHFDRAAIPVKELSLLGFVIDREESERCNAMIMRNVMHSTKFVISRESQSMLRASLYNAAIDRQRLLDEERESILMHENDMIM